MRYLVSIVASVLVLLGLATGHATAASVEIPLNLSCTPINFGTVVSGVIDPSGDEDCYTFSGVVGDRVRPRLIETGGNLFARWEMLRPDGTTLCGPTLQEQLTCQLDTSGSHTLLVRDWNGPGTGDYNLSLQRLNNPSSNNSGGSSDKDKATSGRVDNEQ